MACGRTPWLQQQVSTAHRCARRWQLCRNRGLTAGASASPWPLLGLPFFPTLLDHRARRSAAAISRCPGQRHGVGVCRRWRQRGTWRPANLHSEPVTATRPL